MTFDLGATSLHRSDNSDDVQLHATPNQRLTRSDVHFPLTTPRKRNPSIPILTHAATEDGQSPSGCVLSLKSRSSSALTLNDNEQRQTEPSVNIQTAEESQVLNPGSMSSLQDLPEELLKRILDYIMGDIRPVNIASTSTSLSHRMRHPRRKDVAELALVSESFRTIVQERIYRHIKVKGTEKGLQESRDWFDEYPHLADHVRHIEYWVPVWGDKAAVLQHIQQHGIQGLGNELDFHLGGPMNAVHDFPGLQFKLSTYSATLSQIFDHLGRTFPQATVFTLEGGHCKNSNMIKHFQSNLFDQDLKHRHQRVLRVLPQIRAFAMRGSWNIMRNYDHWDNIQQALPNLAEWHCGYAKPRNEAYATVGEILLRLPMTLRHLDISLDSMFTKDDTLLSSTSAGRSHHICDQLGRIAPRLESLSFTGKVCECFWHAAMETTEKDKSLRNAALKSLDIIVKSCCRQRMTSVDEETGDITVEEVGGIMADGAGIGNLIFIDSFERLVMGAINGLATLPSLQHVKLRYVDLDSPCQQLNPYWLMDDYKITGIWNGRILERLAEVRPQANYEKLEDGIGGENSAGAAAKKEPDDVFEWNRTTNLTGHLNPAATSGVNALYPRTIPKSINTHSYKVLADARST